MKLTKTASGKTTVSISMREWMKIGKASGWLSKLADSREYSIYPPEVRQDLKRMILTWEDDTGTVECPAKAEVCSSCQGRGTYVNPSIDSHGLSADDFAEDPDFAEDYRSGAYDVACKSCGGSRILLVPANENSECAKRLREMMDSENRYRGEVAAERRMFGQE